MKKTLFCLILGCFVIFLAQHGFAVEVCYNWSPYVDVLKVSAIIPDPTVPSNQLLTGAEYASGIYYLPFVGTQVLDADGIHHRFSIHLTNNDTSAFGGYEDCVFDATLSPATKTTPIEGPLLVSCGAGGFKNTGTLIRVKCSTLPSPDAADPLLEGAALGGK